MRDAIIVVFKSTQKSIERLYQLHSFSTNSHLSKAKQPSFQLPRAKAAQCLLSNGKDAVDSRDGADFPIDLYMTGLILFSFDAEPQKKKYYHVYRNRGSLNPIRVNSGSVELSLAMFDAGCESDNFINMPITI